MVGPHVLILGNGGWNVPECKACPATDPLAIFKDGWNRHASPFLDSGIVLFQLISSWWFQNFAAQNHACSRYFHYVYIIIYIYINHIAQHQNKTSPARFCGSNRVPHSSEPSPYGQHSLHKFDGSLPDLPDLPDGDAVPLVLFWILNSVQKPINLGSFIFRNVLQE